MDLFTVTFIKRCVDREGKLHVLCSSEDPAAVIIGERPAAGRYGCQLQSGFVQRHFVDGGLDFVAYCVVGFF